MLFVAKPKAASSNTKSCSPRHWTAQDTTSLLYAKNEREKLYILR